MDTFRGEFQCPDCKRVIVMDLKCDGFSKIYFVCKCGYELLLKHN